MTLHWTREKPTQPGWYWWRKPLGGDNWAIEPKIIHLYPRPDGALFPCLLDLNLNNKSGEWAGPVPEPEDA